MEEVKPILLMKEEIEYEGMLKLSQVLEFMDSEDFGAKIQTHHFLLNKPPKV